MFTAYSFIRKAFLLRREKLSLKTFYSIENSTNSLNHKTSTNERDPAIPFNHHTLSKSEAKAIMIEIAQNKFNATEVTAFISVFLMRNITLKELEGFREALLQMAVPVNIDSGDAIDIVGTGGDGKNTINISTLASFVVAGAGQKVTKHGNYGASTITGSSNVLEELGYEFKNSSERLQEDLEKANICFLHAPYFHPALQSVGALRRALGLRTFFNLLGPLVNPAKPQFSMIGVYNLEIARIYQYFCKKITVTLSWFTGWTATTRSALPTTVKLLPKRRRSLFHRRSWF
jgi:anthranilate phosphoribosyltransferase